MEVEQVPLHILHEDDHLLAVNKPSGIVSHPTHAHKSGTLMNALLWHARRWPRVNGRRSWDAWTSSRPASSW